MTAAYFYYTWLSCSDPVACGPDVIFMFEMNINRKLNEFFEVILFCIQRFSPFSDRHNITQRA